MPSAFTPETAARHIIEYLVNRLDCKANENVMKQSLNQMLNGTFTVSDLDSGMNYAKNQGWIVITLDQRYQLTSAGFSAA